MSKEMRSKSHDAMITEACRWAKSLGYGIVERHLGTETGADAVFQNYFGEKVILEVVTGANFRSLFKKPRVEEALDIRGEEGHWSEILGLIVVGDRIDHIKDHGVEVGLPNELFDNLEKQRVFPVETRHFDSLIPVLMVALLGIRGSSKARVW